MKTEPLPDDADLSEIVRHLNQMHLCEHETQEKISALDGKLLTLIGQFQAFGNERLIVDESLRVHQRELADALKVREAEATIRNQRLIDMILSVQARLGATPGAPVEKVKPIKEPPDWMSSIRFNLGLIGGAVVVAKLVDHFWPLIPSIWRAFVQ